MREVRIDKFCDVCFRKMNARTRATDEFRVAMSDEGGDGKPMVVETCVRHGKAFRSIMDLVNETGRPLDKRDDAAEPEPSKWVRQDCLICGMSITKQNLGSHLRTSHDVKPVKQPKRCPDCGAQAKSDHGMRLHRRLNHGYDVYRDMVDRWKGK